MREYKVGEEALTVGMTSMAQYGGWEKVDEVAYRYDQHTGEKFQIIRLGHYWYSTKHGNCYSHPGFMYYVDLEAIKTD